MVRARVEVLARHAAILFVDILTVESRAINGTQTFQSVRPAEFYSAALDVADSMSTGHTGFKPMFRQFQRAPSLASSRFLPIKLAVQRVLRDLLVYRPPP